MTSYEPATPAIRRSLDEMVTPSSDWWVVSPFAREHFGRGVAKAQAKVEALSITKVLAAQGIEVPDDVYARICEHMMSAPMRRA